MSFYPFDEWFRTLATELLERDLQSAPRPSGGGGRVGGLSFVEEDLVAIKVCQQIVGLDPQDWKNSKPFERIQQMRDALIKLGRQPSKAPGYCLGEGRILIGDERFSVSSAQAVVIEELARLGSATLPQLQGLDGDKGTQDITRLLQRAIEKNPILGNYITLPGKKDSGGYQTELRLAQAPLQAP